MMARRMLNIVFALVLASVAAGFRLQQLSSVRPVAALKSLTLPQGAGLATSVASVPLLLAPSAALADGGGAGVVAIPLAISVLVMVPFLYYQQ